MVFAHGFGCDQHMWRLVAPAFARDFRVILFDFVGAGGADPAAYDPVRHATLDGYAQDLLTLLRELDLHDVVFVGHSVSAMIGVLAEVAEPERFAQLVMVGPSPRYVDDESYVGGFTEDDITEMLESLSSNYLGWSAAMAPAIMSNPERPALGAELTESFCRMDPAIARQFARATFLSDSRADLPRVTTPTLVLQCSNDLIAPLEVGAYVHAAIPGSRMTVLEATGHCPHLSAPDETIAAIAAFVRAPVA
ncbi:alpha/beta hydrolase [Nocardioides sp. KIGAM211]|uniref:Alpha/beta hydrolase n=2 Tax=Nocardioides luti TaxID=2761101 RepID=A0A7X0RJX1_9ACTN|nr:alpha/beta hydrolase [Nocardioides luti]MBB6628429.1 alpha/beta hydrolase [Nocardioides luti]